jgi:hypothetical protein
MIKTNEEAKAKATDEAEQLRPILEAMVAKGATLREMASALAGAGRTTRTGQTSQRHSGEAASRSAGAALRPAKTDDAPTP